jgi:hypothetical protein
MRRISALMVLFATVAAACSGGQVAPPVSSTTVNTAATTTSTAVIVCPNDLADRGALLVRQAESNDAYRISALTVHSFDGCEQLVVEFATEAGAPATSLGQTRVELIPELGIIRIRLPEIRHTAVTDALFDSELLARSYVVRDVDGTLFVDLHLNRAVVAAAMVSASPATVTLTVAPGPGEAVEPASANDLLVVVRPRPGRVSYPLAVTGYARTFEATVVARIIKGENVAAEQVTIATDYIDTWGSFEVTFETGPRGKLDLVVGEDGSELTIPLVTN